HPLSRHHPSAIRRPTTIGASRTPRCAPRILPGAISVRSGPWSAPSRGGIMSNVMYQGRRTAGRAQREVADVADETWFKALTRLGYLTRGLVYMVIGGLALAAAVGPGGQTTGSRGAVRQIGHEPYGQVL